MESQSQVLERLRTAFESRVTIPEKFRRTQLTNLMSMIKDNEEQIVNALHKDLTKVQDCAHVFHTKHEHMTVILQHIITQLKPQAFVCLAVMMILQSWQFILKPVIQLYGSG